MDIIRELINESTGVYDREPPFRYKALMMIAAESLVELQKQLNEATGVTFRGMEDNWNFDFAKEHGQ